MAIKCPKCHSENPETKQFCADCGTQLPPSQGHPPVVTETLQVPVRELMTGSTFAGRYQVIEELGHGGMGNVYKVFDTDIKEKIALKLLRSEIALDKETVERFSNELRLARKISHRNVCRMFDMGKADGTTFITMEFVPGEDLKKFIRKSGKLGVGRAISIAKQVCEGLIEAHHLGVVHRDLKPQNIMVDEDGNARIMDFGIARSLRGKGITGAGVMIGTPEYMSPEQVEGKDVDQRSDIYSLGIILYEMLTGRVPFEGDTALSVAVKHKTERPVDPGKLNPQIPDELSKLILKCMEKEKEERYQRIDEVLSALLPIETAASTTGIDAAKTRDMQKLLEAGWKSSIAVLPFSNLSPEKEQEYFCDGLSEEIINALSHVRELRVVARTSAFAFKGKEVDIREVGEKLKVDAVLEGSVRKAGDKLRITAQLINVADGYHLWSERFDRGMKDVFDIQDEVTLEIVDKLKIELLEREKEQVVKRYTDNMEAHHLLMKSWYFWEKRTKVGLKKSMEYIHQALEMDPAYALAYAQLATNFISLGVLGFARPHEAFPKARAAGQKAVEIDSSLPKAHAALAFISFFYDWDWPAAEKGFNKALSLNPGLGYAHFGRAWYLASQGRFEEAVLSQKMTVALDPLSVWMNAELGYILSWARRYGEAEELFTKAIEMDPNFGYARVCLGFFFCMRGMYREALPEFQKAIELEDRRLLAYEGLAYVYARLGHPNEAEKILHALEERSKDEYVPTRTIGSIYLALGDIDKFVEYEERAIEERDPLLVFGNADPFLSFIRPDSRFKALLKKLNFDK